jgi:hypothetical protein
MQLPQDQIDELTSLYSNVSRSTEGGTNFIFIPNLALPSGCQPEKVDALLCPSPRDGYPSRLFFSQKIACGGSPNWNANDVRILDRNWFAYSFKVPSGIRLAQLIASHLKGLR